MNVSIFSKMAYENKHNWTLSENKPNQTQFKPNLIQLTPISMPIKPNSNPNKPNLETTPGPQWSQSSSTCSLANGGYSALNILPLSYLFFRLPVLYCWPDSLWKWFIYMHLTQSTMQARLTTPWPSPEPFLAQPCSKSRIFYVVTATSICRSSATRCWLFLARGREKDFLWKAETWNKRFLRTFQGC